MVILYSIFVWYCTHYRELPVLNDLTMQVSSLAVLSADEPDPFCLCGSHTCTNCYPNGYPNR
jgi:hypothetical protein